MHTTVQGEDVSSPCFFISTKPEHRVLAVIIFNPDTNFLISSSLIREKGVGGGKQAIIRLALALGKYTKVYLICNTPAPLTHKNVLFLPFGHKVPSCEICITTTSSNLDLMQFPAYRGRINLIWIHGTPYINGIENFQFDAFVMVSHFLKCFWCKTFNIPENKTFVISPAPPPKAVSLLPIYRNKFSLVYASHPAKGLERAIRIAERLRDKGIPIKLYIYGGYELWGEQKKVSDLPKFAVYKGNLPAEKLSKELKKHSFAIHIHGIPEGFGILTLQYIQAGVIPIISNVGANSEIIKNGVNGFLLSGSFKEQEEEAYKIVKSLIKNSRYRQAIRKNLKSAFVKNWDTVAREFLSLATAIKIAGGMR